MTRRFDNAAITVVRRRLPYPAQQRLESSLLGEAPGVPRCRAAVLYGAARHRVAVPASRPCRVTIS